MIQCSSLVPYLKYKLFAIETLLFKKIPMISNISLRGWNTVACKCCCTTHAICHGRTFKKKKKKKKKKKIQKSHFYPGDFDL